MIVRLQRDSHNLTCHKKSRLLFALLIVRQAVTVHVPVRFLNSGIHTRLFPPHRRTLHSDLSPVSLHDIRSTENLQYVCSNFTLHSYHVTARMIITKTSCKCKRFFCFLLSFFVLFFVHDRRIRHSAFCSVFRAWPKDPSFGFKLSAQLSSVRSFDLLFECFPIDHFPIRSL